MHRSAVAFSATRSRGASPDLNQAVFPAWDVRPFTKIKYIANAGRRKCQMICRMQCGVRESESKGTSPRCAASRGHAARIDAL